MVFKIYSLASRFFRNLFFDSSQISTHDQINAIEWALEKMHIFRFDKMLFSFPCRSVQQQRAPLSTRS